MKDLERAILDAWDMIEEQDPDISTERLFLNTRVLSRNKEGNLNSITNYNNVSSS